MKKCKRYLIVLTAVALLLSSSMVACGQPEEESPYIPEELRQIEEHEFFELCQEMKSYIGQAHTLALGLKGFSWHQVDVVYYEIDEYGVWKVKTLNEIIESADMVNPLVSDCNKCRALAIKAWSESPYKEPQTAVQEKEKLTIGEWWGLCGQLESALARAMLQAGHTRNASIFVSLRIGIATSKEAKVREIELEQFDTRLVEYHAAVDDVIDNLEQAKQAASELSNWQFSTLMIDEN